MNLLAFDTSTEYLSVALQRGGGDGSAPQQWAFSGPGGAQASTTLIPAIQRLMQQAGLDYPDLAAIAFGAGPGSFTGLRTACSVAQGLAFAANVPVLPVDSLMAVAEDARLQRLQPLQEAASTPHDALPDHALPDTDLSVVAMLDARMDELYVARYTFRSKVWITDEAPSLIRPEDVAARINLAASGEGTAKSPMIFAGNVFAHYRQRLNFPENRCQNALPAAPAMLRLASQLLRQGLAVRADQALPLYIRDKVAKTTEERLREKAAA